jgi:ribosome-associated heat shock protein Hsp15
VRVNGVAAKPAREVHLGDLIDVVHGQMPQQVVIKGLSDRRGPAPEAQMLYEQTPHGAAIRQALLEQRRAGVEPAHTLEQGRPTKRDRRKLADWNRWSATDEGL